MKNTIREIAKKNRIDEIRFIDAGDLTKEHVGDSSQFIRRQPGKIMPEARSIIITSVYIGKYVGPVTDRHGRMSRLVLSGFYSNVTAPLFPIKDYLEAHGYRALIMDGVSDQNELPIKGAAVKAGLGWIGKNTLLINEHYGSFQALGALFTDAVLHETYELAANRCGVCTKCTEVCPGKALQTPRNLERSRCLSHILDGGKASILLSEVDFQGYFLECDICQNACPWNQRHIKQPLDTAYGDLYDVKMIEPLLRLEWLNTIDPDTYYKELVPWMEGGSISYELFKRNLLMVKNGNEK